MSKSALVSRRIRPQARPIDWSELSLSQREAFRRILYTIDEAITTYDSKYDGKQVNHLIHPNRASNNAFISGSRGTGKTSVLLTLMSLQERDVHIQAPEGSSRMERAISNLKERVIWLEPIDMDPLPEPFSLVTTVLERLYQGIERETARNRGLGKSSVNIDEYGFSTSKLNMEEEFRRLYTNATLAWNSNIDERREHLEPDFYSLELARTNKARLSLNQRISEFLFNATKDNQLGVDNPLFVVTIDDFDMQPTAALRVLKMLRMISVQRVFFLMLGDMSMLELMADLSVSREICGLIPEGIGKEALGFYESQVGQAVGSISRTTLRKVLPPEQRVFVHEPSIAEGMRFRPSVATTDLNSNANDSDVPTLLTLMGNTPFSVFDFHGPIGPKGHLGGFPVVSMLGYLLNEGLTWTLESLERNTIEFGPGDYELAWRPKRDMLCHKKRVKFFANFHYFLGETGKDSTLGPVFRRRDAANFTTESNETTDQNQVIDTNRSQPKPTAFELRIGRKSKPEIGHRLDQITKWNYFWGNEIFRSSPRILADLWFLLRKHADRVTRYFEPIENLLEDRNLHVDQKPTEAEVKTQFDGLEVDLIEDFARFCRNRLLEEPVFSAAQRDDISFSLTPLSYGDFNWSRLPMRLIAVTEPATTIPGADWGRNRTKVPLMHKGLSTVRNYYHEVNFKKIRDWSIVEEEADARDPDSQDFSKGDSSKEVSKSSAASLMILHDMLELGGRRNQFDSRLLPGDDGTLGAVGVVDPEIDTEAFVNETKKKTWCRWASVRYKGSYKNYADLYWPPPSALSFWGLDMFRRCWNAAIEESERRGLTGRMQLEFLAYSWIAGGCAVIEGKNLEKENKIRNGAMPEYTDWHMLGIRLGQIAKDYFYNLHHRQLERTKRTRNWLTNVVAMMMPESGLPTRLFFQLLLSVDVGIRDAKQGKKGHPFEHVPAGGEGIDAYRRRNRSELEFVSCAMRRECHNRLKMVEGGGDFDDSIVPNPHGLRRKDLNNQILKANLVDVWLNPTITNTRLKSGKKQTLIEKYPLFDSYFKLDNGEWMKHGRRPKATDDFQVEYESENARTDINLKWFNDRYCSWIRGFYIVRFMDENKAEIRARRGARLSLLQKIGKGSFTERMLRYHCLSFASLKSHSELMATGADSLVGTEYGSDFDPKAHWLLGQIFDGGGLLPHENEVPGLENSRNGWRRDPQSDLESNIVTGV